MKNDCENLLPKDSVEMTVTVAALLISAAHQPNE